MLKFKGLALVVVAGIIFCAGASGATMPDAGIIPAPKSVEMSEGNLQLGASSRVVFEQPELEPLAGILSGDIKRIHGVSLGTGDAAPGEHGDIVLRLVTNDPQVKGIDGYRVAVGDNVVVEGENYDAVAFGMMSVLQAFNANEGGLSIPKMKILDHADREFRALQVDIKSGYHSPEWVKQVIDLARFYKVRLLELHTTESMWIGCTLESSNGVSEEVRQKNLMWTKKEMDDVIDYAKRRGVFLFPHNESTPHFGGMRHALTTDFNTSDKFAGYMDEVDGQGAYKPADPIPDQADPRYWNFMKIVTQKSYEQFASGWPGGVLPYYHMGPVYGEGGTNPGNAEKILNALMEKNPHIRLMFWCGPQGNDPILSKHKDNLIDVAYTQNWSGPPQNMLKDGYEVVNCSWGPLYILPGSERVAHRQGKWIFDEFQLYRFGEGHDIGTVITPVNDCSQWKNQIVGSMLATWEFNGAHDGEGHLEVVLPCIPFYAEHAWNVTAYPYPEGAWEEISARENRLEKLAMSIVREPAPAGKPDNVTATQGVHADDVDVFWSPGANHPETYQVLRATVNDPEKAEAISGKLPAVNSWEPGTFKDKTTEKGKHYFYWVRAFGPGGASGMSQSAEGFTGPGVEMASAAESFDYPAGASLDKLAGGDGWQSPWTILEDNGGSKINSFGLTYPGLKTSGKSLHLQAIDADETNHRRPPHIRIERKLARDFGNAGTEQWMGFLVRGDHVGIGDLSLSMGKAAGIGKTWGDELGVYTDHSDKMKPDKTYLIVVKFLYQNGTDLISMWIDPTPGKLPTEEDANVISRHYDNGKNDVLSIGMQPYGLGSYNIDEIRIGKTYGEVAPVGN